MRDVEKENKWFMLYSVISVWCQCKSHNSIFLERKGHTSSTRGGGIEASFWEGEDIITSLVFVLDVYIRGGIQANVEIT